MLVFQGAKRHIPVRTLVVIEVPKQFADRLLQVCPWWQNIPDLSPRAAFGLISIYWHI
jgi:hypothetical protein